VVAHYEYSPFGRLVVATGAMKDVFSFRFSTKYYEPFWKLYYYGHRYYSPEISRWLSRDPVTGLGWKTITNMGIPREGVTPSGRPELPGNRLYVFLNNNPLSAIDPKGTDTLLIIIGEEYFGSPPSQIFQNAANVAEAKYTSSEHFDSCCDAVVKVDLTGTGNNAYSIVQEAFNSTKCIRFIAFFGHGSQKILYLTGQSGAGSNISQTGGVVDGFNTSSLGGISKANVLGGECASAGIFSCYANAGTVNIAGAVSSYFGIPVEAAAGGVSYTSYSGPVIPWYELIFEGASFEYVGGTPVTRDDVERCCCWTPPPSSSSGATASW